MLLGLSFELTTALAFFRVYRPLFFAFHTFFILPTFSKFYSFKKAFLALLHFKRLNWPPCAGYGWPSCPRLFFSYLFLHSLF